ncbi:hypothetical protein MANES_11G087467v8 [Manihot esculenta]|uniref:Uncharacterized protein n=1 Tax=Manihot esculenta TaxID=3983 RepID=A0ACB7GZ56_MANES|nr:hypothetical protein MANES_11G087467v8 [Manihot esculenta]
MTLRVVYLGNGYRKNKNGVQEEKRRRREPPLRGLYRDIYICLSATMLAVFCRLAPYVRMCQAPAPCVTAINSPLIRMILL